MLKKISAMKARQNLGQIMNEVSLKGDEYLVERKGRPLVAIIPIEKYLECQKELGELSEQLEKLRAELGKGSVGEVIGAEAGEIVEGAKRKPKGKI